MRNRSYKAKNSKINSLNSNSKQFVAAKRSNGNWCATIKTGVENRFKEHATTAPAVGLKCKKNRKNLKKPATIAPAIGPKGKGLIKLEVQNVIDGLMKLEIVISVRRNGKEGSEGNILIKGSNKDKKKGGAENRLLIRGQSTKTHEDLRVRRSNNTEPNLLTKLKNQAFKNRNRSGNANSQCRLKSNSGAQAKRFEAKTDNSKAYKRVQARNSSSSSVESYQPLNKEQKKKLRKLLKAHLGIEL